MTPGARTPTIDFSDRDHIAIIGDTGAGKSSILEAITYALYGQTTFTAHANQELMNDTSTDLRVVLRFRVAGENWEVARSLRRSAQGGVGQARAQLRRLDDDGEAVEQVEQVRRVNERIVELLGLDSDAFLRTVVLPQGRFARLLVEDEPRDRRPHPAAGLAHGRAGGGGCAGRQRPSGSRRAAGRAGTGGRGIPGRSAGPPRAVAGGSRRRDRARGRGDGGRAGRGGGPAERARCGGGRADGVRCHGAVGEGWIRIARPIAWRPSRRWTGRSARKRPPSGSSGTSCRRRWHAFPHRRRPHR